MGENKVKIITPIKRFKKILLRVLLGLILLFALIVLLFSIPSVQTKIGKRVTNYLNESYNTDINIERVGLKWNGDVLLKGTLIKDHHNDTLIYASKIATSISSFREITSENKMNLGDVDLDNVVFNLKRYKGETSDNISIFSKKFDSGKPASGVPFKLTSSEITIENGTFSYIDEELSNPQVVDYTQLSATLEDFKLLDDTVDTHIESLAFQAARGYYIKDLMGDFHYDSDSMYLHDFKLRTNDSEIDGIVDFDISNNAFDDFNNLVHIEAAFAKADISTKDIIPFYSGLAPDKTFKLDGNISGTLNDFTATGLDIIGLNSSRIKGNVRFQNLVDGPDFRISGNYGMLQTNYFDLRALLPNILSSLPPELAKLGRMQLQGEAVLTSTSLSTKGNLLTALGNANVDLEMNDFDNDQLASYSGNVQLNDFDLGRLIDDPKLGRTTFNLDVKGVGFIQEQLDAQLSGTISSLAFNAYEYKNITVFGNIKAPVFNGEIFIKDPALKGSFNGLIDVSKAINNYDLTAEIDSADLVKLGLVKDSLAVLKGTVVMDMKGTGIDDAFGKISFTDASFQNRNDTYFFKDFEVTSNFNTDDERTITINSPDIIKGSVKGKFKFQEVVPLFKNAIGSLYTNYQPEVLTEGQYMDFDFTINNKIVEVFVPEIVLEPETIVRGNVVSNDSEFKLTFKSPRIDAFGTMAEAIEVRVDNKNPLFNTYIAADSVHSNVYAASDFSLINVTLKDTLFMRSEFKGGGQNEDVYNLSLYHTINQDGNSVLGFKKSDILFKENRWYINKNNDSKNRIIFDNNFKDVDIEALTLTHENEEISIKGVMRDTSYKDIKGKFTNVDLEKITPVIQNIELEGRVNGTFDLLQKNGAYYPNSNIVIQDIGVNKTILGNLDLVVTGNSALSEYDVRSKLENERLKSLDANGKIIVDGEDASIDLDLTLREFALAPFSALGEDVITKIRGFASGNAKVTGDYKNPDINGSLRLKDAGLAIPYLNVDYNFNGLARVDLNEQQFLFRGVPLEDVKHKTSGTLNGTISHTSFDDWQLDLSVNSNRLLVLDTEEDEESLYYGTAFIKGDAEIVGPVDELVINVNAETEPGTLFKIPIDDSASLGDNSFIHFLSPEEKEARINGEIFRPEEVKGLALNFDLNIDQDAEIEIVVDKTNGSTLRGRGAGLLLIEINTNGKFNMWGDFTVYEGVYNFKYGGFLSKEFKVNPLGKIVWDDGSPTRAILDMSAVYSTEANPSILLENPSVNRKIPVEVEITLNGELLKPEITFDINFPNATSTVVSELDYRLSDRNTRELNAISLMSQSTFISTTSISTAGAVNNFYEAGSSLLSNIFFNDNDGVFDVGLDIVQGDRTPDLQSAGRVGFTLSTQITNRVLINGKVGVPTGGVSESIIVGDLEVDFLLNEDGSLRAKVFNRQSDIQFIGETEGYTQGAGISYSVDFNTFKGLLRKLFKGKDKEVREELQSKNTPPQKVAPDGIDFKN